MINSLSINNFKGLNDLKINNLTRINIIGGYNNVGKTSLLEALMMLHERRNPNLILRFYSFRKIDVISISAKSSTELLCAPFFYKYDTDNKIQIEVNDGNIEKLELSIAKNYQIPIMPIQVIKSTQAQQLKTEQNTSYSDALKLEYYFGGYIKERNYYLMLPLPEGPRMYSELPGNRPIKQAILLIANTTGNSQEDSNKFGQLDVEGQLENVVECMREIEPRLKSLSSVPTGNISIIHGDIGIGRKIPINYMGEGTARLLSIILSIASNKNGVVLIDEFENGIHYSKLTQIWKVVAQTARQFNCQVFVTTHSYECISSAYEGLSGDYERDLTYIRLDMEKAGSIQPKVYDYEILSAALKSEFEVR